MDHAVMHAGSVALAVVTQLCSDALCAVAELSDVPNGEFVTGEARRGPGDM